MLSLLFDGLLWLSMLGVCWTGTIQDAHRLHDDLLRNYNASIRPLHNQTEAVQVKVGLRILFIHGLEERRQQFSFSAWFHLEWYDEFLTWNQSDYHGINRTALPSRKVWRPDIAVTNSVNELSDFSSDDYSVKVSNDGRLEWMLGDFFRTYCQVDVRYYPFDTQTCNITLASWMSPVADVNLLPGHIDTHDYQPNIEWILGSSIQIDRMTHIYINNPEAVTVSVNFILPLTRRRTFYILNVILPILMFAFLNVVGFILPPESGEKVAVSASVFLSFSFFMSLLNDSMPRTSSSTPILGIYMLVVMGMGAASVCLSAIIISFHNKSNAAKIIHQRELPALARKRKPRTRFIAEIYEIEASDDSSGQIDSNERTTGIVCETEDHGCQREVPEGTESKRARLAQTLNRGLLQASLIFTVTGALVVLLLLTTA